MRYLKVIAQDREGNGRPNAILLHYHEVLNGSADRLVHSAYGYDANADGQVDVQFGDVNFDGTENCRDARLLKYFAEVFMRFNWFNTGLATDRYMKIFAEDFAQDGTPDTVRLHFHQGPGEPIDHTIVYGASSYDTDNDGRLDWTHNFDVNNDGKQEVADQRLVSQCSAQFLKFGWW